MVNIRLTTGSYDENDNEGGMHARPEKQWESQCLKQKVALIMFVLIFFFFCKADVKG